MAMEFHQACHPCPTFGLCHGGNDALRRGHEQQAALKATGNWRPEKVLPETRSGASLLGKTCRLWWVTCRSFGRRHVPFVIVPSALTVTRGIALAKSEKRLPRTAEDTTRVRFTESRRLPVFWGNNQRLRGSRDRPSPESTVRWVSWSPALIDSYERMAQYLTGSASRFFTPVHLSWIVASITVVEALNNEVSTCFILSSI